MRDTSRAITAVTDRMKALGVGRTTFARQAGVAENSLRDFLEGKTWPIARNQLKIETACGWAPGTIDRIANGDAPQPGNYPAPPPTQTDIPAEPPSDHDEMLLLFPLGVLDSLNEVEREVVETRARLAALEAIERRLGSGGDHGGDAGRDPDD